MKRWIELKRAFPLLVSVLTALVSVCIAFLIATVILLLMRINPLVVFADLFAGAFSGMSNIGATFVSATPLMITGLGIALAFKAGVFNIGVEGQLFIGGMAATYVATLPVHLPAFIHLPLALLAGMAGGALWALLPAVLKVFKNINEVITTILMNYIGINFVNFSVNTFLRTKKGTLPQSDHIADSAVLPKLFEGGNISSGILVGLILAVVLYFVLNKTDYGFQIRCVGSNIEASRTSGMHVKKIMLLTILLSGAIAGLAGACEILGNQGVLMVDFGTNMGYNSVPVALLAGLNPFGIVITSIFFGALTNGANYIQILANVPNTVSIILQAVIVLCVLAVTSQKGRLLLMLQRGKKHAN